MKRLTWCDKYLLAMKEELTVKEIMALRDVGQPKAINIRKEAIEFCIKNNMPVDSKKILTYAVFEVTGHDIKYYYDKMIDEAKAFEIFNKSRGVAYVSA